MPDSFSDLAAIVLGFTVVGAFALIPATPLLGFLLILFHAVIWLVPRLFRIILWPFWAIPMFALGMLIGLYCLIRHPRKFLAGEITFEAFLQP